MENQLEQALEAWDIHLTMFWKLFDAIPPEGFAGKPAGMSGRSVGNIYAHLNNTRYGWIELAAPALMEGLAKIPTKTKAEREAITGEMLRAPLQATSRAMRELLKVGYEKGKFKNLKPHFMGTYSYFVAHEWYHIGEICMTLTQSGNRLDDKILYGLWEWGRYGQSQPPQD